MANYLKPKRGRRSAAESQNIILKRGEIFFECPETGQGTGTGRIKVGDGTTAYTSLPYFINPDNFVSDISTASITFTETSESNNATLLSRIVTGAALNTIIASVKNLLSNINRSITTINNNLTANNTPFRFGYDSATQKYGYILNEGGADTVIPFKGETIHTETYTASSRGAALDMGETHNYRYVNTNDVPNSNSDTYTFPANDTGEQKDLGETNSYRYVNATNVYNKGKADGASGKKTISVANVTNPSWNGTNSHAITWSATSGYVYAVAIGGTSGYTSSWSASGASILGQYTSYNSSYKTGATICILQATSTSVTATYSGTWPYQGAGTVFRIAI